MHTATTDAPSTPTAPDYAPGQHPGPQFARALRRAAERDLRDQSDALVRDAAGVTWRRTRHEGHRAAVARYATSQQVARTKLLRARQEAADALKTAQEARDKVAAEGGDAHAAAAELRRAKATVDRLAAEPLPEVPPVPKAGQPAEPVYVGGARLVVNRYADRPAGTCAPSKRARKAARAAHSRYAAEHHIPGTTRARRA